eukprot:SAG31_NODE_431_length_15775_cov_3.350663_6_plen_678_part_00
MAKNADCLAACARSGDGSNCVDVSYDFKRCRECSGTGFTIMEESGMNRKHCFSACLQISTEIYSLWAENSEFNAEGIIPQIGTAASCWAIDNGKVDTTTTDVSDVDDCQDKCKEDLECVAFTFNAATLACRTYDVKPTGCASLVPSSATLCTGDTARLSRRPIFSVDVVDSEIVFSGPASTGLPISTVGSPSIITGPDGASDGIFFGVTDVLLLGSDGIDVADTWSIDVWFSMTSDRSVKRRNNVLVSAIKNNDRPIAMPKRGSKRIGMVLEKRIQTDLDLSKLSPGWHRLTVVSNGVNTKYYVDAERTQTLNRIFNRKIVSIGNFHAGKHPWGPMHQFRLYDYALSDDEVFALRELQSADTCYYDRVEQATIEHPSYPGFSGTIDDWLFDSCCDFNKNPSPNRCEFHVGSSRNKDNSDNENRQASVKFFCSTLGGISDGALTNSLSGCPPFAPGSACDSNSQCSGLTDSSGKKINSGSCRDDICVIDCDENDPCPLGSTNGDYKYHHCSKNSQCKEGSRAGYCEDNTCHAKRENGAYCEANDFCIDEYCVNSQSDAAMFQKCATQCSTNNKCKTSDSLHYCTSNDHCKTERGGAAQCFNSGAGRTFECIPLSADGEPCTSDGDCENDFCRSSGVCRTRCSNNNPCTSGLGINFFCNVSVDPFSICACVLLLHVTRC